ncbi:unnamed protein product [Caenorhabditis brenneri]
MTNKKKLEWSDGFPDDVKKEIISFLDYESRCHLKLCSKSDYDLVNSTKFVANELEFHETLSQFIDDKTIIRIDIDTFTVWFSGKENLTRIDRGWNEEIIEEFSEIKQKNRYELIKEFMDRYSYKGLIKAVNVTVDSLKLLPHWKFDFQRLSLCDVEHYRVWLQNLAPKLKKLQIGGDGIREEMSKLKVSESLNLYNCRDIQDEDLEDVTATDIRIYKAKLSRKWVRKMLEHHLKNGNRSDVFEVVLDGISDDTTFNPFNYIPDELICRRDRRPDTEYTEYAFYGKIYGGFWNIHGVQDRRRLSIIPCSPSFSIRCEVYKSPEGPYEMDPIYEGSGVEQDYRRASLY